MKRILSGIKPSGGLTLGNYLGAMKRWAEMSNQVGEEHFFFIPNLHALNARPDPDELKNNSIMAVAWLLASGVNLDHSYIFMQSEIPAHAELAWILNNYTTVGELNRMTQFKDKAQKGGAEGQLVGLYDYPVLMAADILLYDTDEVPIGEDQKQHVELTRDIATRFNNLYGETFKIPKPTVQSEGARIMDLQDPNRKMSKSDADLSGCILLLDNPDVIEKKVMRAVTDSGNRVSAGADKPALTNLLVIMSVLTGVSIEALEQKYADKGYADFKRDLAGLVVAKLEPLQKEFKQHLEVAGEVQDILATGKRKAASIANQKLDDVKTKLGLF